MVFQTPENACDQIFRTFSSSKTETRLREHFGYSYPKIRNKDDKNFTPKMTFFQMLEIFFETGMCSKSLVTN